MSLDENHLPNTAAKGADGSGTRPHEPSHEPSLGASQNGFRSWTLTIAISTAVLVAMYGLAYWNEARGDASRATSAASMNAAAPDVTKAAGTPLP